MKKNAKLYEVREITDLRDMLNQSAVIYADKNVFKVKRKGEKNYSGVTFRQYKADVQSFGTMLLDLGLLGKRVAILGKTCYEWYVSYMATVNGLGVVVPLDKEQPKNEMKNMIERAECSAIIFGAEYAEVAKQMKEEIPSVEILIGMDEENHSDDVYSFAKLLVTGAKYIADGRSEYVSLPIDREAMSILLFTSGTTAKSKAVMLSHKNICKNLMAMCSMTYIDENDTFLSVLPLHHTYECTCGFLCQVYRGCEVAVCEGLRHIVKNMGEARPTMMLMVPLMVEMFHKKIFSKENTPTLRKAIRISNILRKIGIDLRKVLFKRVHVAFGGKLRLLISGGASIDPMIIKDLRDVGLQCLQGYGLTECAPILALNRDVFYNDKAAGLSLPGVDIKIINKDEDGIGEIIGKGDNVMIGYYGNEEATKEAIVDGYYHTGDLGYIDDDGFVIITGRKKNVIVTKNGKNVFPEELEYLLNRSEFIAECVVRAQKSEDSAENDGIEAEILPDFDAVAAKLGENYSAEELTKLIDAEIKEVNRTLPTYKYIKDFTIREEEFKKTTSKKIIR